MLNKNIWYFFQSDLRLDPWTPISFIKDLLFSVKYRNRGLEVQKNIKYSKKYQIIKA